MKMVHPSDYVTSYESSSRFVTNLIVTAASFHARPHRENLGSLYKAKLLTDARLFFVFFEQRNLSLQDTFYLELQTDDHLVHNSNGSAPLENVR